VINIHPSLLPKFRGPSPIQNALLNGETETGTTLMLIDGGIDTGNILKRVKTEINRDENAQMLSDRLASLSADLLLETLPLWIEGKIESSKQMDSEATLCQLIERNDGRIIWTDEAESIHNRFRALSSWPGIFTFWENEGEVKRIKLNKISFLKENPDKIKHHLGEVFQFGEKIGVQTILGIVILEEIQPEGKENMKIADFINGYQNFLGSILK
jgi:methionyl-tRNA formyltransferase